MNKFFYILFFSITALTAQEFFCSNEQIAKDYLNGTRSDIVGITKYSTISNCESNCKLSMTCGPSVEHLESATIVEPTSFLLESQAIKAIDTLKGAKINAITVVKDGVQKTKVLTTGSNFSSVSFPSGTLSPSITSLSSSFNIQSGLSMILRKKLGTEVDERTISKAAISVGDINPILNTLSNSNPSVGVKYIVIDGTKFDISINGTAIPQIIEVPAYTGPMSGYTISGDSLAGGLYGLKKNTNNTFSAYANGIKGSDAYITSSGLLSTSTLAGTNVGLLNAGAGFATKYNGVTSNATNVSGSSIVDSATNLDASSNIYGLTKVSAASFAYTYGASGNGSSISWVAIVPSAASTTTTLYSSGSDYIKYIQDGSTGVIKNYIEYKKNGVVKYAFKTGVSSTLVIAGTKFSSETQYAIDFSLDGVDMSMEDGQYDDGTGLLLYHWVSISANLTNNGFTCPMYSSAVDIGGNIKPNMFSTKSACDLKCVEQKECMEWVQSSCVMEGAVETAPVTDYTGKNVNTKKTYTWKCPKTINTLERCDAYKITQTDGKLNYSVSGTGWETKDFTESFAPSIAGTYMAEQMQHIWTGWGGYCENGIKMDNSWMSDPMQLLSLCMMAYSGAMEGAYGDTVQGAAKGATTATEAAYNSAVESVQHMASESKAGLDIAINQATAGTWLEAADTTVGAANEVAETGKAIADAAAEVQENLTSVWETASHYGKQYNEITSFAIANHTVVLKWTDFAQMALVAMSDVEHQDVQVADQYFKTQMGGVAETSESVRYANCMASIGLSMPNMIAYAVDSNETSSQLKEPFKNPLRVTDEEMGKLIAVLGAQVVTDSFRIAEYDAAAEMSTIIAINGAKQSQAGSIICAASPAVAASMIAMQEAATKDGPDKGAAMANAAIGMVLGKLPPPYNLIASVIFKIFTSISSGNACMSEKIAQQWGPEQYRTYKSIKGLQCHATKSDCVKKWFWGSCMLTGNWYCCYDQEITRIFVEGLKEQIGKGWESCSDLTIYDLKNVSFRPCEGGQSPAANKCFPRSKYNELTSSLMKNATKGLSPEVLAEQTAGALTIPGRDPWSE